MTIIELIVYGWLLHFVADWFFQNDWMAVNKVSRRPPYEKVTAYYNNQLVLAAEKRQWRRYRHLLRNWETIQKGHWYDRHPAAYVHAGIHTTIQLIIFPWWAALIIGVLHFLIDLRTPLTWWRSFFHQTQKGPAALHVAIWQDQVAHLLVIALVAQLV